MSLLRRRMLIASASKGKSPVYEFPYEGTHYGDYNELLWSLAWAADTDYFVGAQFWIPSSIKINICGEWAWWCKIDGSESDPIAIVSSDCYEAVIDYYQVVVRSL